MKRPTTRRVRIATAGMAGVAGVAGWLLLGPLGAVIGVVAGPLTGIAAWATFMAYAVPSASDYMDSHEPYLALQEAGSKMRVWRKLARWWPGQFLEPLAIELLAQAEALHGLGRSSRALGPAAEAVGIYQDLAARRPRKFEPDLAGALDRQARLLDAAGRPLEAAEAAGVAARLYRNLAVSAPAEYLPDLAESLTARAASLSQAGQGSAALEAATEAAGLCQDRLPRDEQPRCAAQAYLLQGRLLAGQARYGEAAGPLARGWQLAVSRDQQDLLAPATQALRAAYRADQAVVLDAWHAEAAGEPPGWLTRTPPGPS
jgi:tetratricopeptide (TPR) repeat protein